MTRGMIRGGGLPGLPGRVTLSAGVKFCHVGFQWKESAPRDGGVVRLHLKRVIFTPPERVTSPTWSAAVHMEVATSV